MSYNTSLQRKNSSTDSLIVESRVQFVLRNLEQGGYQQIEPYTVEVSNNRRIPISDEELSSAEFIDAQGRYNVDTDALFEECHHVNFLEA